VLIILTVAIDLKARKYKYDYGFNLVNLSKSHYKLNRYILKLYKWKICRSVACVKLVASCICRIGHRFAQSCTHTKKYISSRHGQFFANPLKWFAFAIMKKTYWVPIPGSKLGAEDWLNVVISHEESIKPIENSTYKIEKFYDLLANWTNKIEKFYDLFGQLNIIAQSLFRSTLRAKMFVENVPQGHERTSCLMNNLWQPTNLLLHLFHDDEI